MTFVVDKATIASVQADAVEETGYLAKPYRYLPLFAPGQGASNPARGLDCRSECHLRLDQRTAEQLPNKRHRFAVSGESLTGSPIRRFDSTNEPIPTAGGSAHPPPIFDSSSTSGRRFTVWPHLRFHIQNQVAFWQRAYEVIPGPNGTFGLPTLRSGDRELSQMYMGTAGGGIKFKLIDDARHPWAIVLEGDASLTRYFDTLYISQRRAIFTTLAVEAEF